MASLLYTIASFLVALAILIAVHEFGHYWVARRLGVKVLRFSIGFGKPLLRFRGRPDPGAEGEGTEYVIAAVPLGGYVKMLDEREGEVSEQELPRAFNRQRLAVRSAIVFAGPLFNFLFAIFAFWLINVSGDIGTRPVIGTVLPGTMAAEAGFAVDDEIIAVGEKPVPTWESAIYALLDRVGSEQDLAVRVQDADGYQQTRLLPGHRLLELTEEGGLMQRLGVHPKRPRLLPVIGVVVPGEPADQAGIRPGDLIEAVDGQPVESWSALVEWVRENPGHLAQFDLSREGLPLRVELIIGRQQVGDQLLGRIGAGVEVPEGAGSEYRVEFSYGPVESVGLAVTKTLDMSVFMLKILGKMIVGEVSVRNISGPISIAETAGKSASYGWIPFLKFLALVSVSLGVLNLLPVPVLDGGHLFFYLLEAIKGGPLSDRFVEAGQKISLLLLLLLMSVAFYVDITRLLGGG